MPEIGSSCTRKSKAKVKFQQPCLIRNLKLEFLGSSHTKNRPFLCIHPDDTPEASSTEHVLKSLVDFREGDFMGDKFL